MTAQRATYANRVSTSHIDGKCTLIRQRTSGLDKNQVKTLAGMQWNDANLTHTKLSRGFFIENVNVLKLVKSVVCARQVNVNVIR